MTELSVTMLWCAAQVTVFLALAAPVYLGARRLHPRAGTFAALGSLAAVMALSLLAGSPWPRWSFIEAASSSPSQRDVDPAAVGLHAEKDLPRQSEDFSDGASNRQTSLPDTSTMDRIGEAMRSAVINPAPMGVEAPLRRWPAAVVIVVAAGLLIGMAQLIGGLLAVRRLATRSRAIHDARLSSLTAKLRANLAITKPVELRESSEVVTPAALGWRRPVILLPAAWRTWNEGERRSVLAHELAHIAEHDFAAWIVARLTVAIHFYHPLVRWFARRLQLDQELAADAAAVRVLGNRRRYLEALASLALSTPTYRLAGPARTFIPSRSLLVRRIEMLRGEAESRNFTSRLVRAGRWTALAALGVLAVATAGLRQPLSPSALAVEPNGGEQASAAPADAQAATSNHFNLAYLPDEFLFFVALRPQQAAQSPRLKEIVGLFKDTIRPQ